MLRQNAQTRLGFIVVLAVLIFAIAGADLVTAQNETGAITTSAEELAAAVAAARAGDIIEVTGGIFHGQLLLDKSLTLTGTDWPIVDGGGQGTVIHITAEGASVSGFIVRNSGSSLDQENSGIVVEAANTVVSHNRFEDTLFGIYLRNAHGSIVRDNVITSKPLDVPRRGDPIRVWYSNDVLIEDNVITEGRDVVLWYSERLTVRNNDVRDGRYGLHFMYCDDATVRENRLTNNSVGAFLMYSRRVLLQWNTIAYNRGPSGYGVGLKDMDDTIVEENLLLDNRIGAHLDTSPREVDSVGRFAGNVFAYNDIGVGMSPSVRNNEFVVNSFVENGEHVAVEGQGQLGHNVWTVAEQGNYWSDYAGFDADGDDTGDIPYRSERLFEDLMRREPNLRLLLYSPATNALDFAARAFPFVRPQPKLEDSRPLMSPRIPGGAPILATDRNGSWYVYAAALLGLSMLLSRLQLYSSRRFRFPASHGASSND